MADENNLTTLAKRLRPLMKFAAQEVVIANPVAWDDILDPDADKTFNMASFYTVFQFSSGHITMDDQTFILDTNGDDCLLSTFKGSNSDGHNIWIGGGGQVSIGNPSHTNYGARNVTAGIDALLNITTGYDCIGIGNKAGYGITTGYANIAIGSGYYGGGAEAPLYALTTARGCIGLGSECLTLITERDNIAIGLGAIYQADNTYNNIGIGTDALWSFLHGPHANKQGANYAIGSCAMFDLVYGENNIGIGEQFGTYYTSRNTMVGSRAGDSLMNGSDNVGVGAWAMDAAGVCGNYNVAVGNYSLSFLSSGELNSINQFSDYSGTVAGTVLATNSDPWGFGLVAGVYTGIRITGTDHYNGTYSITVIDANNFYFTHAWNGDDTVWCWMADADIAAYANGNTAVGCYAGDDVDTGSYNTTLGYEADVTDGDEVNSTALGANALVTKSNQVVIGDTQIVETLLRGVVGINEATIAAQLDVAQTNAAGVVPVLELDQADQDESFINFVGTSAADQTKSISTINGDGAVTGPKNFSSSAGWEYVGMVKIDINGSPFWIPYYQPDIA